MSEETDFVCTVSTVTVHPRGGRLEDDHATAIRIADEGAGAFVEVEQFGRDGSASVAITPEEWPEIRRAIDALMETAERMK